MRKEASSRESMITCRRRRQKIGKGKTMSPEMMEDESIRLINFKTLYFLHESCLRVDFDETAYLGIVSGRI